MDTRTIQAQETRLADVIARLMNTPTRRDPQGEITLQALGRLGAALSLRDTRADWLARCYRTYGDAGSLISGCERDHWPEDWKDRLRQNAHEIGDAVEDARTLWRRAGRTPQRFRETAQLYRRDDVRY